MKKLLSEYSFTTMHEYFWMIAESYVNGQFAQAHEQIKQMPKKMKKEFLLYLTIPGPADMSKETKIWCIKHGIELI